MKNKLVLFMMLMIPFMAHAADCETYPYTNGINIEDVPGGTKIISTAAVTVSFDDPDSVLDARDEAMLEAKAAISKFLSETISSDETIKKAVNETKSMSGAGKAAERTEVIERVKKLRNTSQALLRGVVPLGDCYTKGKEVRVSVGLKPETIKSAGSTASSIAGSPAPLATVPSGGAASSPSETPGGVAVPDQGVDSYSNTERLKNF